MATFRNLLYQNEKERTMKQGELRRALLVVMMLCILLFIYLFWQQSNKTVPNFVLRYKQIYTHLNKSNLPLWTWDCINQRCEKKPRQQVKENHPLMSLATCSMLCGSTQLWPQPTGPVTLGTRAVNFHHQQLRYENSMTGPVKILLDEALSRFNDTIVNLVKKSDYLPENSDITRFIVRVKISEPKVITINLKIDESYSIDLKHHNGEIVAMVSAKTYFGARHGLETLSQMIWWDEYANGGFLKVLKVATVQDSPAFPYRGLMIDTSRNFMSVESLKKVLIGMAANKLNVFHWHLTDSQSFPLLLPSIPQLAKYGAYSAAMTYAPEEVSALVDFARVNGIRVILEVDTPAHAGNGWTWGPQEGLGDLAVCVNERPWSLYCGEPPCGQLNPENPHVYEILEKLYKDLLQLSEEREIFHIGGDEVNLECWAQHMTKSNTAYNYTDLHDLWGEFTLKALSRLNAANDGKNIPYVIVWSSNLSKKPYIDKYLDKSNIVVQSWGSSQWPDTPDLIADGYKVIISHVDAWYLDCGFGRWRETGEAACDPYRPWQTVYNHRPWQQFNLNKKQILGGEACLWSEQVDERSLETRLWPRAAAFAERLWSDPQIDVTTLNIQEDVYTRLNTQRTRLVSRGMEVEALWPEWCSQNPGMCL